MLKIFLAVLTAILSSLKIAGIISTSWWLILLPIYGPAAILLAIIGLAALLQ